MWRPEAMVKRSTWGLMLTALVALALSHATSISTSKWPMLLVSAVLVLIEETEDSRARYDH